MSARDDLLRVADSLASEAKRLTARISSDDGMETIAKVGDVEFVATSDRVAGLARGAREALQAAQLVDADPAPITAAIERLYGEVDLTGFFDLDTVRDIGGAEGLVDELADTIRTLRQGNDVGRAYSDGYQALEALLRSLLRDFTASDTNTARRIAARIDHGLDEAEQAIRAASTEGTTGA